MASTPPKKAAAYSFTTSVASQADTKKLQVNPTIAAGDWKISKDGGALANLTNLPTATPAGGALIAVSLTAAEMTADRVDIVGIDAAGAEWCDVHIALETATRQLDDLAFPAVSGRSINVAADGSVTTVLNVRLKKNTAFPNYRVVMTDSTTHNPAPGKTVTVTRAKDAEVAFTAGTLGAVVEMADGAYKTDIPAADFNANSVMLKFTAAGCDVQFHNVILED